MKFVLLDIENNACKLDEALEGVYSIVFFTANNTFFNITNTTNKLKYNDGIEKMYEIPEGFYNAGQLEVKLKENLDFVDVNYNINTHKFHFEFHSPATFNFENNETLRDILGNPIGSGTELESEYQIDLHPIKTIYMRIEEGQSNIFGTEHFSSSCFFRDRNTKFGSVFQHETDEKYKQYLRISNTGRLTFRFYDKNGNTINIRKCSLMLKSS